jgi:hypothetical protein
VQPGPRAARAVRALARSAHRPAEGRCSCPSSSISAGGAIGDAPMSGSPYPRVSLEGRDRALAPGEIILASHGSAQGRMGARSGSASPRCRRSRRAGSIPSTASLLHRYGPRVVGRPGSSSLVLFIPRPCVSREHGTDRPRAAP